ncbi:MAG: hypothetical protein ACPGU7_14845 [Gammaproteobacteria bacterium]
MYLKYLTIASSVFVLVLVAFSIRSGRIRSRQGGRIAREEKPAMFWASIAFQTFIAGMVLFVGVFVMPG